MPQHEIEATLPAHRVVNTDMSVTVKSDGKTLGELLISKGSIDWHPSKRRGKVTLQWEAFASLMERVYSGELR
jgi:hypothetical protein